MQVLSGRCCTRFKTRWVPAALLMGGAKRFIRRPHRFCNIQGGLYLQYGGVGQGVGGTCASTCNGHRSAKAEALQQHKITPRSLDNGGCIVESHIVVDRCLVLLCIPHCSMAIGRLQVALIEAHLHAFPKENAKAVWHLLYRGRTSVQLGAAAAPEGVDARAPSLAWEEVGQLVAYALGGRQMASLCCHAGSAPGLVH